MTRIVHTDAEIDLVDGARYYQEQAGLRLAQDFLNEFERSAKMIESQPHLGSPWIGGTRRWILKRFPYSIVYQIMPSGDVWIMAVAHQSRHPNYWTKRK
jgi:toxin ParE1/3/4